MKRETLEKLGLTKEQLDSVMAEYGKDVEASNAKIATLEQDAATAKTTIDGLKQQISQRDTDIEGLKKSAGTADELTGRLNALQEKYNADTKKLNEQLSEQAKDFAADKFFDGYRFSSKAARRAAMQDFKASENVKFVDGGFVGGKEFMEKYKQDDPESFIIDEPASGNEGDGANGTPNGGGQPNGGASGFPRFAPADGGQPNGGTGGNDDFSLSGFNFVRPVPEKK